MRWGWEDWRIAHLIRKEFATKVGRWQRLNYCNMIRTRREKNITILCWRMLFCNIGNFKFNLLLLMKWVQQLVYLKVHISADHCYILIIYTYITRIFFLAQQKKCFSLPPKSNSECFHQLLQMLLATKVNHRIDCGIFRCSALLDLFYFDFDFISKANEKYKK